MGDFPKRVRTQKGMVFNKKRPIRLKDGKIGVYDPNFSEVDSGEVYPEKEWKVVAPEDELIVYDSLEETDIGTFEDGLEATYTFKNYDESVLKTGKVKDGETPVAPADPTRPATAQYTYTFSGWNPAVGPITKNTSYIAQYTSTVNTYTITFKDYDNSVISEQTLEYGASPVVPSDPTRSGYRFTGWSPAVAIVTQDATYTAQYVQQFIVTIEPNNSSMGSVSINSETVDSGTGITTSNNTLYVGDTEVVATAENGYTFSNWTDSNGNALPATVTGNLTVVARFEQDAPLVEVFVNSNDPSMGLIGLDGGTPTDSITVNVPEGTSAYVENEELHIGNYVFSYYQEPGFEFLYWDDGSGLIWDSGTTIEGVCTFMCKFANDNISGCQMTIQSAGHGDVYPDVVDEWEGEDVYVTEEGNLKLGRYIVEATPDEGYIVDEYTTNLQDGALPQYTESMDITAHFIGANPILFEDPVTGSFIAPYGNGLINGDTGSSIQVPFEVKSEFVTDYPNWEQDLYVDLVLDGYTGYDDPQDFNIGWTVYNGTNVVTIQCTNPDCTTDEIGTVGTVNLVIPSVEPGEEEIVGECRINIGFNPDEPREEHNWAD